MVDFRFQALDLLLIEDAFPHQEKAQTLKIGSRRASSSRSSRTYRVFRHRKANANRARHLRVDQRGGRGARGQYCDRFLANGVAFDGIGAVALRHVQPGKLRTSFEMLRRPSELQPARRWHSRCLPPGTAVEVSWRTRRSRFQNSPSLVARPAGT